MKQSRRHLPSDRARLARAACIRTRTTRVALAQDPHRRRHCRRVVHAITDGRDTPPQSAGDDLAALRRGAAAVSADRDGHAAATTRWTATSAGSAWRRPTRAMVDADGPRFPDPQAAIADAYAHEITRRVRRPGGDRRLSRHAATATACCASTSAPTACARSSAPCSTRDFTGFARERTCSSRAAVGMTHYSEQLDTAACRRSSRRRPSPNMLGEVVGATRAHAVAHGRDREVSARHLFPQRRRGGASIPGEDRIMVPSPKVATYDLQPEMSAPELTDKAVEAIDSGKYDLIVLNYANPDMVGHTGSLPAAIKAVETVDTGPRPHRRCHRQSRRRAARHRRPRQLRADARPRDRRAAHRAHHQSGADRAHRRGNRALLAEGRLADIAPTLLELMDLPKPPEMTGVAACARPAQQPEIAQAPARPPSSRARVPCLRAHSAAHAAPRAKIMRSSARCTSSIALGRPGEDHAVLAHHRAAAQRRKADVARLARAGLAVAAALGTRGRDRRRGRRPRRGRSISAVPDGASTFLLWCISTNLDVERRIERLGHALGQRRDAG